MHDITWLIGYMFAVQLTDFVCLYTYEFWLSLWKIVRSSVILLLPLLTTSMHWLCYCSLHVSLFVFIFVIVCGFFFHSENEYVESFSLFEYVCIAIEDSIMKKRFYVINRFTSATFILYVMVFFRIQLFEMGCSFLFICVDYYYT